jgi:hypothetical protein
MNVTQIATVAASAVTWRIWVCSWYVQLLPVCS